MAMGLRSRGAAAGGRRSRTSLRPVYEDFKPMFEWKHEDGVDVLLYHLPGFAKEQIRIIAESKGILRVRGERLITGNKWSRFEEEFVVPQDCNLSQIRAKFEDEVLRIIMPKIKKNESNAHMIDKEANKARQPPPSPSVTTQPNVMQTPQLPKEALASGSTLPSYLKPPQKARIPHLPLAPREGMSEPQANELHETSSSSKPSTDPRISRNNEGNFHQRDREDNNTSIVENKKTLEQAMPNAKSEGVGYQGTPQSRNKIDESGWSGEKMHAEIVDREKENASKFDQGYGNLNQKNLTNGHVIRRLDQDRRLLMNMGAAILVIMALGASISYTLGSTDQFN